MIGLPPMANQDGIQKYKQTKFGGYNHTLGADNGDIWDMKNMTSDFYPLLAPRRPRWKVRRRNAQGNCHEREKEVREPGRVHHHPAGQEVL